MRTSRRHVWSWMAIALTAVVVLSFTATAQDDKAGPEPAAGEAAPAAEAPAAPEAVDPKTLPPYETGLSPDSSRTLWPDKTGANAGYWATPSPPPVGDGDPAKTQTIPSLFDRIVHNLYSINIVWAMVTGFLVMFMQAGFAMVECGLSRSKNSSHTIAMNFMIYPLGASASGPTASPSAGAIGTTAWCPTAGTPRSAPAFRC